MLISMYRLMQGSFHLFAVDFEPKHLFHWFHLSYSFGVFHLYLEVKISELQVENKETKTECLFSQNSDSESERSLTNFDLKIKYGCRVHPKL